MIPLILNLDRVIEDALGTNSKICSFVADGLFARKCTTAHSAVLGVLVAWVNSSPLEVNR